MSEINTLNSEQDSYRKEIEEKGLNNFYADVEGGYRREGFKNESEMLAKRDPKRRMGKSIEEYWEDIDKVFLQAGIDKREISNLQEQIRKDESNREDLLCKLNKKLEPAYFALRQQGYTQLDIWS